MKIKLKGVYPRNRTIPEELKGRTYEIGNITGFPSLTDDGLTIMISDTSFAKFLKSELELRRFKGILKKPTIRQ